VNAITLPMQLVASRIAEAALGIAGVPVYRDGNILALPSTSLQVAEACSGLRSLLSLTAIGAVIAWTTERAAGRRLALIAACVPIAVIMNALRIAATGIACEAWGPSAASEPWHSLSGWLTFVLSVVVLIGCRQVATRMRWTRPAFSARPASV
jgi:eight transmembrane protein EpsH (proposed exosortase)